MIRQPLRPLYVGLVLLLVAMHQEGDYSSVSAAERTNVEFLIDVEAAIAKGGCNAGACHGNKNGKGGFRLSLRGEDPRFDYQSIVKGASGRRIDTIAPAESLLLQKPSLQVAHRGGLRWQEESDLYSVVREWIAAGATFADETGPQRRLEHLTVDPTSSIEMDPVDQISLRVTATFSDGSQRDVTPIAVYETSNLNVEVSADGVVHRHAFGESTVIVRYLSKQIPIRLAFLPRGVDPVWRGAAPRSLVDHWIFDKLKQLHLSAEPECTDSVFLRRLSLDLLGLIPTAAEAKEFVDHAAPDKRQQWVDRMLARPEFAKFWGQKWADLLRVEENVLDNRGVDAIYGWIEQSLATGKPLDEFVSELIAARGSSYSTPPSNYYRAFRRPNERSEATAQIFLGTRLQCAQCHNHPFDRWTQEDYFRWAALFACIDYEIVENKRYDDLDKKQFNGEQIIHVRREGELRHPGTGGVMAPQFLGSSSPLPPHADRLVELADWLTSSSNRQFARAQVNRVWFHLMGRGLVDPVDDFRSTNPPSHPELLEALTDALIDSGYDLRHLIRLIVGSATYQQGTARDTEGVSPNEDYRLANYGGIAVRRLTAEQLLDAQSRATETPHSFLGYPLGTHATHIPGIHRVLSRKERPTAADRFLFTFGKPERLLTSECERSDDTTLTQAVTLISGVGIQDVLERPGNRIAQLAQDADPVASVEQLFWGTLGRPPQPEEVESCLGLLRLASKPQDGWEDIGWALLNAKEFVFRY